MNVLTRRCGCGAIFALVHLRDRSQQCSPCQRKEAARLERAHLAIVIEAGKSEHDRQQTAARDFMRWAMEKLAKKLEARPCP